MTQKHRRSIAPGLSAIAAVLALHATPVAAQETAPPTTTTDIAPAPTPDPVPVASDPLAPETQADVTATAAAPTESTQSTRTSRAATRPAARAGAPRPTRSAAAPAASTPAPAAEPAAPVAAEPAAMMPPPPPVAEPAPAPAPEPVASDTMEDILPIAGAAGAGVLALAGLGVAMRNRRRRCEEEDEWAYEETIASEPAVADPEPVMARPGPEPAAVVAPVAASAMATPRHDGTVRAKPSGDNVSAFAWGNQSFAKRPEPKADPISVKQTAVNLPEGFDVSRFGRHVQAAYQGPTPENPSLSLKNRLRRASFFDKVERDTGKPHPLVSGELEHQH